MAVGEHDVLAAAVDLPEFSQRIVRRASDAVLRVVVLIRIERVKNYPAVHSSRRVAAQDKRRRNAGAACERQASLEIAALRTFRLGNSLRPKLSPATFGARGFLHALFSACYD